MPRFYELLQVVLQYTTLLGSMTFLSMVSAIQALIPSNGVSTHFSRPLKVRLILNTFEDLIDKLLKRHINSLGPLRRVHTRDPWLLPSSLLKPLGTIIFVVL